MNQENNNDEKKLLLDHDYDGIKELDHPLPFWWLAIFYLTVAFSVVYYIAYTFDFAPSILEVYNQEWAKIEEQKKSEQGNKDFNQEEYNAFVANPENKGKGLAVFTDYCLSCHAEGGRGDIGPNMTDDYWIHANGTAETIFKVAITGVEEKGMPPWGEVLSKEDLYAVVSYLMSIHGSNPPNAKAPQGELIVPQK